MAPRRHFRVLRPQCGVQEIGTGRLGPPRCRRAYTKQSIEAGSTPTSRLAGRDPLAARGEGPSTLLARKRSNKRPICHQPPHPGPGPPDPLALQARVRRGNGATASIYGAVSQCCQRLVGPGLPSSRPPANARNAAGNGARKSHVVPSMSARKRLAWSRSRPPRALPRAYLSSPRIGWPLDAACTRIWCVRPVFGNARTCVVSLRPATTSKSVLADTPSRTTRIRLSPPAKV